MKKLVIDVAGVSKRFGDLQAVDGVDLSVVQGEVLGLIGHNGAGKSTLFKLMLGLLRPDAGEIRLDGVPVAAASRALRARIAYLPENVVFYDNLSGLETMRFFADLKGANPRTCAPLLEKVGLGRAARRAVRGYSKGMRQRLGFAQLLLGSPDILFLDEPTTGLDPEGTREFYEIIGELKTHGVTAVLASHNLAEIQDRVDKLALMQTGRVRASGTVQSLRDELKLPLGISLALRDGAGGRLQQALAPFEDCKIELQGARASVRCARDHKMAVLRAITALDEAITDMNVHEPSLEDVFLGYTYPKG